MSKQVMQRALEALEEISSAVHEIHHARQNPRWFTGGERAAMQHEIVWIGKSAEIVRNKTGGAIAELRAAIAQPEVEPVAIVSRTPNNVSVSWIGKTEWPNLTKLFTAPPDTEAMRRDAERYEWFADIAVSGDFEKAEKAFACFEFSESCTRQEIDQAIDAAIAAQGGGE